VCGESDPQLDLLPVVLQTAMSSQEDLLKGIRTGAYYYLMRAV
jgi:CheY-like chemotaxis protein